jgi:hypothetical protein
MIATRQAGKYALMMVERESLSHLASAQMETWYGDRLVDSIQKSVRFSVGGNMHDQAVFV